MSGLLLLAQESTAVPSMFSPVSPPAESIRDLTFLVFAITGVIFLIVEGILIYCLMRFRHREASEKEPPQIYGSRPIEIAWTAAPILIVAILVLVNARTLWDVTPDLPKPKPGDNTLLVTVIGRQWWWEYRYTSYNGKPLSFITANELHIPVGNDRVPRPVFLTLQSADVYHSFWVPQLAGKTALIPGRTNTMWFQTQTPGLYVGQCAEYCGTQHANMLLRVYVDPLPDFEKWLSDQERPAAEKPAADDPKVASGRHEFLSQSCVNCHRVRGTSAAGTYAPDLTHLMSRQTLASGMIPNDPEGKNLRAWIANPQKIKSGCLMPSFHLRDQLDSIVSYLRTLQ
jgi:cytochrome c oxidase subunit 2